MVEVNFCRRCGLETVAKGNGAYKCANGHHVYYKSYPAAGMLFVNSRQEVLLSQRGIEPNKGMWDVPGGFCNPGESFKEAIVRELTEELGLAPTDYTEPVYVCEATEIYPYEGEDDPVIHLIFTATLTNEDKPLHVSDDVAAVEWLPLATVDFGRISKDAHSVRAAIDALRKQLA